MKNFKTITAATLAALTLMLSACGGGDSEEEQQTAGVPDLESAKKVLYVYGASSNDHYAYFVESGRVENLNDDNVTELQSSETGRLFYFRDNTTSDTNASNDVDKVIMFKSTYSFSNDGNATWEDFYYLDHLSGDERHPHDNDEFNVTSGSKFNAMNRLNQYLADQEQLKNALEASISNESIVGSGQAATEICDFYTVHHEDEKHYFALGTNGKLYTFDNNTTDFQDATTITTAGCEVGKSGIVAAQEGVLVYLGSTSKIYLLDSHDEGVTHVHSSWDLSEVLSGGKSIDMMVGIGALESEEHAH